MPLKALVALLIAGSLLCPGCAGKPDASGATSFRPDARYAYVTYIEGPCDAATTVDVDLDTGHVRVGTGPTSAQSVYTGTIQQNEIVRGREFFADEKIAVYQQASSSPAGAGGAPSGGNAGPSGGAAPEDPDDPGSSDAGTSPNDNPGLPPANCTRTINSPISVVVFIPPGSLNRVHLNFPSSGTDDPDAGEMLRYFVDLAATYPPVE